jgi:hypothetical protein
LSYSYVNESRGQVSGTFMVLPLASTADRRPALGISFSERLIDSSEGFNKSAFGYRRLKKSNMAMFLLLDNPSQWGTIT